MNLAYSAHLGFSQLYFHKVFKDPTIFFRKNLASFIKYAILNKAIFTHYHIQKAITYIPHLARQSYCVCHYVPSCLPWARSLILLIITPGHVQKVVLQISLLLPDGRVLYLVCICLLLPHLASTV